jgi:hypothetical protein
VLHEQPKSSQIPSFHHTLSLGDLDVEYIDSLVLCSRIRLLLCASFFAFSIAFTRKSFCSSRSSFPRTTNKDHSGSPLPGWMHVSIVRGAWSDSGGKLPGGLFSSLAKSATPHAMTRGKSVIIRGRVLEVASKSASLRSSDGEAGSNCRDRHSSLCSRSSN